MVRRAIRDFMDELPQFERLLPYVRGNVGFVFTNGDLKVIREKIVSNRLLAPARSGAIAPLDVYIPPGNTGMGPEKTNFFQALGISTKISRGTIEIISQVHICQAGNKVGPSEATLLNMLNISPFTYGMTVEQIFDSGQVFNPAILDITEDTLISHFLSAVTTIASISLATGYPTLVSVMHSLVNSYKNVLGVSIATDYTFDGSEQIKGYLANPSAFAMAAPAAAAEPFGSAKPEDKPAEEEEESDEDMAFGLFD
ncbi:60S acidic ribosomal protein P0 [Neolecta irregularis DAH-3]|uniref:Large ribosomal subunit protein uL10 n=1 Tax=Neolecta irregularis (strain DAH-3) TaxID=1198029 RepID=A0A1U7LUW1_NEOID|nr:60S acidic ribosomal protein P0 [Neolecta irregularis DAH-3]|eukprot:OLL26447.1 60S acidic ribosomal protein P0 [Neolecta irregularis DAH-3]